MKLKEAMKKEIDEMDIDDMLFLYEQMKLLRRKKSYPESKYTLEKILKLTSPSKSNWSEDVIRERQEKG